MDSSSANSMVLVELTTFVGQSLGEFELSSTAPILALNHQIVAHLHVPLECQQLLIGTTILNSSHAMSAYCESNVACITIVLVLVLEPVWQSLTQDASKIERRAAENALEQLITHFSGTVSALVSFLDDERQYVRYQVMDVLKRAAAKSDARAVEALYTCVEHAQGEVRAKGLRAISHIAKKGEQRAIDLACGRLSDEDCWVREESLLLLSAVGEIGDTDLILAVLSHFRNFGDRHEENEHATLTALACLAEKGNRSVVDTFISHLHDPSLKVREFAIQGLAGAIDPSSSHEVDIVIDCLSDDATYDAAQHSLKRLLLPLMNAEDRERAVQKIVSTLRETGTGERGNLILSCVELAESLKNTPVFASGENNADSLEIICNAHPVTIDAPVVRKMWAAESDEEDS